MPGRGQIPDRVAPVAPGDQPEIGRVVRDRPAAQLHAHQDHGERRPAGLDLRAHPFERGLADVVRLLLAGHLVTHVALEGHGFVVCVLPPREDARLDAALVSGGDHHELVRLARLEDCGPQLLGVQGGVPQVDLVALLAREARLRNDHRTARDLGRQDAVVGEVTDSVAHQVGHQRRRLRPLDLDRADVNLLDFDVHPQSHVDALEPEEQVGVRQREPEFLRGQPEQHRVVEDAAPLVAEDDVAPPHRLDAGGVAGDDEVGEPLGVRSAHADLALDGDVPQRDVLRQRLVLGRGPAVLGPHVAARMVGAVVGRRAPATRLVGQVPVGRLPDAGGDEQLHGRPAALAKVDRNDPVGLVHADRLTDHRRSLRLPGGYPCGTRTLTKLSRLRNPPSPVAVKMQVRGSPRRRDGAAGWERRSPDRHPLRGSAAHGTTLRGAVAFDSWSITTRQG